MKIKDMRSNRRIPFSDVPVGTVIKLQSGLWIKVEPYVPYEKIDNELVRKRPYQLVRLDDGMFASGREDTTVSPVSLEIEIHDYNPDEGYEEVGGE